MPFSRLRTYLAFVRFSHTVFALPFALVGALLASRLVPMTWSRVGWIVAAMVAARSAAMAFNRLVDAHYDALNPRTAQRELPRGAMSQPRSLGLPCRGERGVRRRVRANQRALSRARAGGAGHRVLVFARQALHVGDAVLPGAGHGGGAGRRLDRVRWRHVVAARAARARDRHVGRWLRRALRLSGPRFRPRARPEVDSRAFRRLDDRLPSRGPCTW